MHLAHFARREHHPKERQAAPRNREAKQCHRQRAREVGTHLTKKKKGNLQYREARKATLTKRGWKATPHTRGTESISSLLPWCRFPTSPWCGAAFSLLWCGAAFHSPPLCGAASTHSFGGSAFLPFQRCGCAPLPSLLVVCFPSTVWVELLCTPFGRCSFLPFPHLKKLKHKKRENATKPRETQKGRQEREREGGAHQTVANDAWAATNFTCASSVVGPCKRRESDMSPYRASVPFFASAPHAKLKAFVRDVRGFTRCVRFLCIIICHGRRMNLTLGRPKRALMTLLQTFVVYFLLFQKPLEHVGFLLPVV